MDVEPVEWLSLDRFNGRHVGGRLPIHMTLDGCGGAPILTLGFGCAGRLHPARVADADDARDFVLDLCAIRVAFMENEGGGDDEPRRDTLRPPAHAPRHVHTHACCNVKTSRPSHRAQIAQMDEMENDHQGWPFFNHHSYTSNTLLYCSVALSFACFAQLF